MRSDSNYLKKLDDEAAKREETRRGVLALRNALVPDKPIR